MKNTIANIDESMLIAWKVLSFFSLTSDKQKELIGECENYFFKSSKKNDGENYLFGVLLMANEYVINSASDEMFPDMNEVLKLKELIGTLIYQKKNTSVKTKALERCNEWIKIREISQVLLFKMNLHTLSLKKPFKIEEYVEVSGYL